MDEQFIFDNTIFAVTHGSRCYGTNVPGSDYDEKGICVIPDERYYFGFSRFEQKDSGWSDGQDRQIYDIRKFFRLALACNPNIIEVLFVEDEDIKILSYDGAKIRCARDMFLSRRAAKTFTGYALSQLKKLKNRVERGETPKWKHAMHLIRLCRMGYEIIKNGKVLVRRPDAAELLKIRHGEVELDDIVAEANERIDIIDSLVEHSPLPANPDTDRAEQLMMEIIRGRLK